MGISFDNFLLCFVIYAQNFIFPHKLWPFTLAKIVIFKNIYVCRSPRTPQTGRKSQRRKRRNRPATLRISPTATDESVDSSQSSLREIDNLPQGRLQDFSQVWANFFLNKKKEIRYIKICVYCAHSAQNKQ